MKRIISISICMVFLLSASTIFLAQEKVKEPMTFPEFKDEVNRIIAIRNQQLKEHFSDDEYHKMPGKLEKYHTKLVTHDGKVIPGEYSESYWRKVVKKLKGTELDFEDPDLRFMELEVSLEPGDPGYEDEINYVGVEITTFSFKVGKKTYKGYIDPTYRHRVKCEID